MNDPTITESFTVNEAELIWLPIYFADRHINIIKTW